jgi:2-methylcitrate dehydratase PrpD
MTDSLTRSLLEPLLGWRAEAVPGAGDAARSLLLDHIGVAAWGSRSDVARTFRAHATEDLARAAGPELAVFGTGQRCSAVEAAMANAVAAACFEFDDTHTPASAHPGAVIFPAALAAAAIAQSDGKDLPAGPTQPGGQARGSGERFLTAVCVGYEVMCRVARAVNPHAHRARHFHPTSTAGHFGAAAAAAICLDLSLDQAVAALSLAGTVAGGSMQFLVEGAVTKQLHPAYAVQRGVQAALLARRGFPGLADPIGGARGFLAAQSADPRPERLLAGLGTAPAEITCCGIKPYPSCRNTQSPVDALFSLLGKHAVPADQVAHLTFGLIGTGLATVWDPPERRRRPKTLAEAQFSMPFVAAVALLDGRLEADQFQAERYTDPAVVALMDRVDCVADSSLDARYPASWPAWAQLTTIGGQQFRAETEHPRGDPDNPLSRAELTAKFDSLTRHCYDPARTAALHGAVQDLPDADALETIMELA